MEMTAAHAHYRYIISILVWVCHICFARVDVTITGAAVTDIAQDLGSEVSHLRIDTSGVTILDLTQVAPYSFLREINIFKSKINQVIPAPAAATPSLKYLRIFSYNATSLPDLGDLESALIGMQIWGAVQELTPNYFTNFSSMVSVTVAYTYISHVDASSLYGLERITALGLTNNGLGEIASYELWTPLLTQLELQGTGATFIPGALLMGLPHLETLDVRNNLITTVPSASQFQSQLNLLTVKLLGNPLVCDERMGWLKVYTVPPAYIPILLLGLVHS